MSHICGKYFSCDLFSFHFIAFSSQRSLSFSLSPLLVSCQSDFHSDPLDSSCFFSSWQPLIKFKIEEMAHRGWEVRMYLSVSTPSLLNTKYGNFPVRAGINLFGYECGTNTSSTIAQPIRNSYIAYKIFNVVSRRATAANGIWLWQIARKSLSILLSADVAWCIHLNSYPHSHNHINTAYCIDARQPEPYAARQMYMAWKC